MLLLTLKFTVAKRQYTKLKHANTAELSGKQLKIREVLEKLVNQQNIQILKKNLRRKMLLLAC